MFQNVKSVRPSRITIVPKPEFEEKGSLEVYIEFQCPNCMSKHTMLENAVRSLIDFNNPGWHLPCGYVEVELPWPLPRKG